MTDGDRIDRIRPAFDEAERLGRRQSAKLIRLIREARIEHDALEEIARAARDWDADLSDYCDGPIRDRLRSALARWGCLDA